jgi:hypothetical protein
MERLKSITVDREPRPGTSRAVAVMVLRMSYRMPKDRVFHALDAAECAWRLLTKGTPDAAYRNNPQGYLDLYNAVFE